MDWGPGQASGFLPVRQVLDGRPAERGVAGNQPINALCGGLRRQAQVVVMKIRGNLDEQRRSAPLLIGQGVPGAAKGLQS